MSSAQELADCLEEIARAVRHHLADPVNRACRDRLSTATADAYAVLYDAPRPRRVITVEELLAGDPVVKVGTDPSEAVVKAEIQRLVLRWSGSEEGAADWFSRLCPGLGVSPQELMNSGRSKLVLQHLRRIGDGGYA